MALRVINMTEVSDPYEVVLDDGMVGTVIQEFVNGGLVTVGPEDVKLPRMVVNVSRILYRNNMPCGEAWVDVPGVSHKGPFCVDHWWLRYHYEPDMGDDFSHFYPGTCQVCQREGTVFSVVDW